MSTFFQRETKVVASFHSENQAASLPRWQWQAFGISNRRYTADSRSPNHALLRLRTVVGGAKKGQISQ